MMEPVEHPLQVGRGDALAGVPDDQHRVTGVLGHVDRDPASTRRVAERVRHQVGQDLADADGVHVRRQRRTGRVEGDPRGQGRGTVCRHDLAGERTQVGRFAVEGQCPGLGERQRAEVIEQGAHDPALREDGGDVCLVHGMDAVEHRLEAAGDHGQRRPELVGHVGQQRAPLVARAVQALRHRVERGRQVAHRTRAAWSDPDIGGAVRQPFGGVGQLGQRPNGGTEQPNAGPDRHEHHHDDRDRRERRWRGFGCDEAQQRAGDPRGEGGDPADEHDQGDDQAAEEAEEAGPVPGPAGIGTPASSPLASGVTACPRPTGTL